MTGCRVPSPCLRRRSQHGLAPATELVIVVPAVMLLLGLVVAGGRIWFARSAVNEAAYSGARAASIERSAQAAESAGRNAAHAELGHHSLPCRTRSVRTDVAGFSVPIGQPAHVGTAVRCRVSFGDLLVPGIPGSITFHKTATAALDTYRER